MIDVVVPFTTHHSFHQSWEANGITLYTIDVSFDVDNEVHTGTNELKCVAKNISVNPYVNTYGLEQLGFGGFIDVFIVSWKFTEKDASMSMWPAATSGETWASVRPELDQVQFPGSNRGDILKNGICGYWFNNAISTPQSGPINFSAGSNEHTFKLDDLMEEQDFVTINGITRLTDTYGKYGPVGNLVYAVTTDAVQFDVRHPWLDYYPLSRMINGTWESCNRYGVNNRVGFLKMSNGNGSWRDELNNFIETEPQTFYMYRKNGWKFAPITGEHPGEE